MLFNVNVMFSKLNLFYLKSKFEFSLLYIQCIINYLRYTYLKNNFDKKISITSIKILPILRRTKLVSILNLYSFILKRCFNIEKRLMHSTLKKRWVFNVESTKSNFQSFIKSKFIKLCLIYVTLNVRETV